MTIDPMVFAAAMVVVISAVSQGVVAIIKQRQAVKLMEDIKTGNKEIHQLVNSAASKTAEEIVALKATIAGLHTAMAVLQSLRVSDAQQLTTQAIDRQSSTAPPSVATQVVENQIVDRQSIKKET